MILKSCIQNLVIKVTKKPDESTFLETFLCVINTFTSSSKTLECPYDSRKEKKCIICEITHDEDYIKKFLNYEDYN